MKSRSRKSITLALAGLFILGVTAIALVSANPKSNRKSENITVTGCLQKGDEANEFMLTTTDGKLYGLRSTMVKLSDHVGHTVAVTGRLSREEKEGDKDEDNDEAKESGKHNGKEETGDILVTSLKMVSKTCS